MCVFQLAFCSESRSASTNGWNSPTWMLLRATSDFTSLPAAALEQFQQLRIDRHVRYQRAFDHRRAVALFAELHDRLLVDPFGRRRHRRRHRSRRLRRASSARACRSLCRRRHRSRRRHLRGRTVAFRPARGFAADPGRARACVRLRWPASRCDPIVATPVFGPSFKRICLSAFVGFTQHDAAIDQFESGHVGAIGRRETLAGCP